MPYDGRNRVLLLQPGEAQAKGRATQARQQSLSSCDEPECGFVPYFHVGRADVVRPRHADIAICACLLVGEIYRNVSRLMLYFWRLWTDPLACQRFTSSCHVTQFHVFVCKFLMFDYPCLLLSRNLQILTLGVSSRTLTPTQTGSQTVRYGDEESQVSQFICHSKFLSNIHLLQQ